MDAPTLRDELDRKTSEALVSVLEKQTNNELTPIQARIALDTLWATVAGLVSNELMTFVAEARNELNLEQNLSTALFNKGEKVVLIERALDEHAMTVKTLNKGVWQSRRKDYEYHVNPACAARDGWVEFRQKLTQMGFKEIV